ncbi:MAG TPA: response regulator transcription factor [Dongiaceae bacterium]|nr:response regulator transcription factor [Dongiaceae bacterium]
MGPLRILIADDHPSVRILLRTILESVPEWVVCGEAVDGAAAVVLAVQLHPDVIVMDLVMPKYNGYEAARQVLHANREARIVLTTLHETPSFVDEARRCGACGCFLKTESGRHLIPAVRAAARKSDFFTPQDLEMARLY